MRIFAAAKITADRARRLDSACAAAQNAAEIYKDTGGSLAQAAERLGAELEGDGTAVMSLPDGLSLTMTEDAEKSDGYSSSCDITVSAPEGVTIFTITASAFLG